MKIIHTSDWHLGQRFYDRDRYDEHQLFLDFLLTTIEHEEVELLIVAGDIFDTANPPTEAERIYFDFLHRLAKLGCCQALIIGGNHDSATHLDAPNQLLEAFNIHVVGSIPENREDALRFFESKQGKVDGVHVAAVPYLRDGDVRKAVAGESYDDMEARTKAGILKCYADLAELADRERKDTCPLIATGHLTMLGAQVSDSERSIHIGNLGSLNADRFPKIFDYIALGHLHRPQAVGGADHIRYCGSPIPLSFSEADAMKEIHMIECDGSSLLQRSIEVPCFRPLLRLEGNPEQLRQKICTLELKDGSHSPWLEVIITDTEDTTTLNDELRALAAENGVEILKVGVRDAIPILGSNDWASNKSIKELKPFEVFQRRIEGYGGDGVSTDTLIQCFHQLLTQVEETE